jgi:DNA-binding CsgD family transcriptional regulator
MPERRLSLDQTRRLLRLAREAEGIAEHALRARLLLRGLARIVGAETGVFVLDPPHAALPAVRRPRQLAEHGVDDAVKRALTKTFERPTPSPGMAAYLRHRDALHEEGVVTFARPEVMTARAWRSSDYYAECMRPCRLDEFAYSLGPASEPGCLFGVALHRAAGGRAFDDRERSLLHFFQLELAPRLLWPKSRVLPLAARRLPPRQREVLQRLLAGDAEKEVARCLGLTAGTVHQYVKDVYRACGVSSRAQLMAHCLGRRH